MKETRQALTETAYGVARASYVLNQMLKDGTATDIKEIELMRERLAQAEALIDQVRKQLFDLE